MIGCKSGILDRISRSQAGVGQGSPLYETHDCVKEISTWAQEYFLKLHTVFKQGCWNKVVQGSAEK